MLKALHIIRDKVLWDLLEDSEIWQTLDIDYEPPHVERLWLQYHVDYRLYIHLIHPCDTALFHPHPWPSAVMILDGRYEMAIGYGSGSEPPPVASTAILTAGSSYEMLDPNSWHSVRPLDRPSLSIMLAGKPFGSFNPASRVGKDVQHPPLTEEAKQSLFQKILSLV